MRASRISMWVACLSLLAPLAAAKTAPADQLRLDMRKLWEDHITYTRNYIISALADLPDKDAVAGRLLRNQDDIGAAVATYYGADAGKKLAGLLRDHIMVATEVVAAARNRAIWVALSDQR